jgi:hypothetical protein
LESIISQPFIFKDVLMAKRSNKSEVAAILAASKNDEDIVY